MSTAARRRRGQPLLVLGAVLMGWIALRAALWDAPPAGVEVRPVGTVTPASARLSGESPWVDAEDFVVPIEQLAATDSPGPRHHAGRRSGWLAATAAGGASASTSTIARVRRLPQRGRPPPAGLPSAITAASGEPQAPAAESLAPAGALTPLPMPAGALAAASRWSGDGWLLVRRGASGFAAAVPFASYGASQAGAVLRYALDPGSARAPAAYVRLSRALGFAEAEAAVGVSLRPLAALPVRLLGEVRVQRSPGRTRLLPAASVVTVIAPQALPLRAEAEIYAQAGYFAQGLGGGGDTPFFDAQLTADRPALAYGPAELRFGAAMWAGGQEGAVRLDLGPRVSARLRAGPALARLALDYRVRVAGNAAPDSGPALTFSAGF